MLATLSRFIKPVAALALLAGFCAAPAGAGTHFDAYLVAGQSNMDGRGRGHELTNSLAKWLQPQPDVRIFYANPLNHNPAQPNRCTGWDVLKPGFSVPPGYKGALPSTSFGPELSFARTLADRHPERHIALIKITQGGTSLSRDWNPASGYMYATFTNMTRQALRELENDGNTCTLQGMIWHQGESDESSGALYEPKLVELINDVRRDLGAPNLPFVVGEIATNKSSALRQAQRQVSRKVSCVGFASAEGLRTYEGTHFVTADVLELGRRFAAALEAASPAIANKKAQGSP